MKKTASTQYNDWVGSIALDNLDLNEISKYARGKNYIENNDIVFGFEIDYLSFNKTFLVKISYSNKSYDEIKKSQNTIKLSNKEFEMSPSEFTSLFKQINIIVNRKGLDL